VHSEALEACRYLIERVRARAGRRWCQGPRRPPWPCSSTEEVAQLIARRRLCAVPETAARALSQWVEGRRPALRLDYAPPPRVLLAWAARGRRPVSLLEGENGLEFALHDLCHLEKFADPDHYAGQVGLFALLDRVVDEPAWAALEAGLDAAWCAHRDHVLADMNGSAVYLFLVLRARLIEACARIDFPAAERVRQFAAVLGAAADADHAALAAYFSSVGADVLARAGVA
jgi:hypothetical protein